MGRFHAVWRRERQVKPGESYMILKAKGRGHYVGVYLYMRGLSLKNPPAGGLGFLEGNVRIEADGEVAYQATGTEDYFLSGWYFSGGPYTAPFHGLIHKSDENHEIAAYRFHILDPIPFRESLTITTPHGEWNEVEADYSSVAYWYDPLPALGRRGFTAGVSGVTPSLGVIKHPSKAGFKNLTHVVGRPRHEWRGLPSIINWSLT